MNTEPTFSSPFAMKPALLRHMMNVWPPFAASGIQVREIAGDWSYARVELRLRPWNRNYMGTQFGGHLFKMCDPFWAIMAFERLGRGYIVWDASATIDFLAPGRETVQTEFHLDDATCEALREATSTGKKHLQWFDNDIVTADDTVVARVRKQLYVRRKPDRANRRRRSA
jgi:acyl-coenzyme A thioesterase PaaI-like protein